MLQSQKTWHEKLLLEICASTCSLTQNHQQKTSVNKNIWYKSTLHNYNRWFHVIKLPWLQFRYAPEYLNAVFLNPRIVKLKILICYKWINVWLCIETVCAFRYINHGMRTGIDLIWPYIPMYVSVSRLGHQSPVGHANRTTRPAMRCPLMCYNLRVYTRAREKSRERDRRCARSRHLAPNWGSATPHRPLSDRNIR